MQADWPRPYHTLPGFWRFVFLPLINANFTAAISKLDSLGAVLFPNQFIPAPSVERWAQYKPVSKHHQVWRIERRVCQAAVSSGRH
jgi:hypothetical protein